MLLDPSEKQVMQSFGFRLETKMKEAIRINPNSSYSFKATNDDITNSAFHGSTSAGTVFC